MDEKAEYYKRKQEEAGYSNETTGNKSASVGGSKACFDGAQDALNRMKRAQIRGTGCHLTSEMVRSLYLTFIGQMWGENDPREKP